MDKEKEKEKEREIKDKEKERSKPFTVTHQKVTLDVEFSSRTIFASTELQIFLNSTDIPFLRLHSKSCDIENISVNDIPVKFEIFDPCIKLCTSDELSEKDCDYSMFQKLFDFARSTAEQGELAIEIPESINLQEHLASDVATKSAEKEKAIENAEQKSSTSPLILKIDYSIPQPESGLMFSANRRVEDETASYLYTTNQLGPGDARCWIPSLDEAHGKCTWELDFIVSQGPGSKSKEPGFTVIASGVQIRQDRILEDSQRSFFRYFVPFPCPAYLLSFAIGKFDSSMLTELENYNETGPPENGEVDSNKKVTAYSPVGWKEELRNTCQTVVKIMEFYLNEFGSYPLDSVKLVFLQTSNAPIFIGAEVIILSLEFLHPEEVIDQTYESRRIIALALASQWFGVGIVPKASPDIWLVLGLSGFMTSLFLKMHLGRNEYRYRMKQDMIQIANLDTSRPPLYNPKLTCPYDSEDIDFIRLKATFVLYMLDKQMMKGAASAGLHRLMPKMLVSAMCGELGMGNTLSTAWFMRTCRKISGVEIKPFADQWIYCSGCPRFQFSYSFNRKKMVVEISAHQSHTNVGILNDPSIDLDLIKPARFFSGHMTASIREPDGTPYEHVLEIQEDVTRFEVQFNTKYKRIRRNTKRFQKRKAEAAAAEAIVKDHLDGDNAAHDDLFLAEEGKEKEKEEWRIVEWGEADEESLESATFEWIRLDSDFEWICQIELQQPEYMWAGQLEKDRDVVSQFEAVEALKRFPSQATSTTLLRTVMNSQCFYRIRADAAMALVHCDRGEFGNIGRHHLLRIFHKKYCVEDALDERNPELFMPKPLDFSNLAEYFVQKAVVLAISLLNDDRPDPVSHRLLLNLLINNDNSNNAYSDCYFVGSLITALGNAFTTVGPRSSSGHRLIDELKRYATLDCLIPSYHNVVTVSCLQTFTRLYLSKVIPPDLQQLMSHSRYGNFLHVRMAAFDGLLLLDGLLIPKVRKYLLNTIEVDPDRYVRGYIATNIARLTAIYLGKQAELASLPSSWVQFQKCPEVCATLHRISTNPQLDPRLRRTLNILCNLLYPSPHRPLNLTAFQIRINEAFPTKSKLIAAAPPIPASPSHAPVPSPPPVTQPALATQVVPLTLPPTLALHHMTPPAKHQAKLPIKLPSKAPVTPLPGEGMATVKILVRNLFGHDSVKPFLNRSNQWNIHVISSKVKRNQYSSLEQLRSDFDEMFAFYKELSHSNGDLIQDVRAFEDFYHQQFEKLKEAPPAVPPVKLHLNPPRPPSPERTKLVSKVSKPARPTQENPPPEVTGYKNFESREEYEKAKAILAEILDASEAEPFLFLMDNNKVNIGLKGARRKLKCEVYTSGDQMYEDILTTINFIAKSHPHDSDLYRSGRSLQDKFDALWHKSFPNRVKARDAFLPKSKDKAKHRPSEAGSRSKLISSTQPLDEPLTSTKAKKKHKSRSPSPIHPHDDMYDDFMHPSTQPREPYIKAEQEFSVPSPIYAPKTELSDRISLSPPQPPKDIRSKKHSHKHNRRSPSPLDTFFDVRSPSPVRHMGFHMERDPTISPPSEDLFEDHMQRSPVKPMRDTHTDTHRGRQKTRMPREDLFEDFDSPSPFQQLLESRHRPKNRSPSEHFEEEMCSGAKNRTRHKRTPQHEELRYFDEPQSGANRHRFLGSVTPIQDEVVERHHKHSRGGLNRQRSGKRSLSPRHRQSHSLLDSPHSGSRQRPRQKERELSPEASHRQRQMPSSPQMEPFPIGLTPGVLPRHRSTHAIEDPIPFEPTPDFLSPQPLDSPEPALASTSKQRIKQEESIPNRKIKLKIGSLPPSREASRHQRSVSRERASSSAGRKHRRRSRSPVYDHISPGHHHKRKIRQRSPSPMVLDELEPSIHRNKRSQMPQSPKHEEGIIQQRHNHPKLSPSPVSGHFDPPSCKQKPPNNERLYAYCKRALDELDRHPSSPSFRVPVDPVLLGIPTYFDIVKHPMDLRTVRTRLEARKYTCFEEFDCDVLLISDNACLFNHAETWVHTEAVQLREHYVDFKARFEGHFLSKSEVRNFRELLGILSQGSFIQTFNPPTQFCRYMPEPIDVDRLGTLLSTEYFFHIGEIEKSFKAMLMTAYSFFPQGSPGFKNTLRLERHYASQFTKLFNRSSAFMGNLSQEEPLLLMTPEMKPQCMQIIKKLLAMKAAFYFSNPVDYVALQLPHYPTIIRQPMDLGTVKKKLVSGAYCTLDQLESDVLLIAHNCYNFNGIDCSFSAEAKKLEVAFKREWALVKAKCISKDPVPASPALSKVKASLAKLSQATQQQMQSALNAIKSFKHYGIFGSPVDYVGLNIPQYPQIIKDPMDFGTIQKKLKAGSYETADAFLKDANLVFTNCFKFNFPGDPVYVAGQDMEREWESICQKKGLQKDSSYLSTEEISIISPKVVMRPPKQQPIQDRHRPKPSHPKAKPPRRF